MDQSKYKISSERAIENLIAQYTHLLDKGDFAGIGAMFTHGRIGSIGEFTEGADIKKMLHSNLQVYPGGTPQTAHVTTNTVIRINEAETSATAVSYVTIFQQDVDRSFPLQPIMVGQYDDTFDHLEGEWHFRERSLSLILTGDLSHHAHPEGPSAKKLKEDESN
jgi:hypothetical protein